MKKYKKNFNISLIKKNYSYSSEEICKVLKIHINTITKWQKDGLQKIDDKRPYLFWGNSIINFLKERMKKRRFKCNFHEFFCFKCYRQVNAFERKVAITRYDHLRLNLSANCQICNSKINKAFSIKDINKIEKLFITQPQEKLHLIKTLCSGVISDLGGGVNARI